MKIEEMMNRQELAVNIMISLQNQLNYDKTNINYLEDIEFLTFDEIKEYMKKWTSTENGRDTNVLSGWIFNKRIYDKMYEYYDYEIHTPESDLYVIIFPEYPLMIVNKGKERYNEILHLLNEKQISKSSLNIRNIIETDNGIEINYYNRTVVKPFEKKPTSVEKRDLDRILKI